MNAASEIMTGTKCIMPRKEQITSEIIEMIEKKKKIQELEQ